MAFFIYLVRVRRSVLFGEIAMTAKFGLFRKLISIFKRWLTGSDRVKSQHQRESDAPCDRGVFAI